MKIYVGYIITDYARPLYISKDKKKVKEAFEKDSIPKSACPYIEEYELNNNNIIDLDCD